MPSIKGINLGGKCGAINFHKNEKIDPQTRKEYFPLYLPPFLSGVFLLYLSLTMTLSTISPSNMPNHSPSLSHTHTFLSVCPFPLSLSISFSPSFFYMVLSLCLSPLAVFLLFKKKTISWGKIVTFLNSLLIFVMISSILF